MTAPQAIRATNKKNCPPLQSTKRKSRAPNQTVKSAPGVNAAEPKEQIEKVFRALDRRNAGVVSAQAIIDTLKKNGILIDDPRIRHSILKLNSHTGPVTLAQIADIFDANFSLIECAVKDRYIVPQFSAFTGEINNIFDECMQVKDGAVADYIPQLARIDPEQFAVAITTTDGQRAAYGDFDTPYCVQSSCKPVNYAMALEQHGEEFVHGHVGREPSGRGFNELALNPKGLPHNPMINAGAIMSCSMIDPEMPLADRFDHVVQIWTKLSGGSPPGFNNSVFLSEKATADRNFALAYFMQEKRAFPKNTNMLEALDFYFQACSIEVTARQMSVVAATLANSGVCPMTNERIFSNDTVKNCLSLMYSCGMYDFSGEFAFTIGLPAKSGVSGALMVVIPQVMGFAIWSPRLDELGNSVRGVEFCRKLVERFSFHNYDNISNHATKKDPTKREAQQRSDQTYQLINAASLGDINEISRLVAHGAEVNAADYDGRTPLHLAAAEGRLEAVDYLLLRQAEPTAKDRWGATPIDDAKRHRHPDVEKRLRARRAGLCAAT